MFKSFGIMFTLFILLFVSIIGFGVYNYSQKETVTITVKDKYIFTTNSKNSSDTHYRIVATTGEFFDCYGGNFNPLGDEKLYNSLLKDSTYTLDARGVKNEYNVRMLLND